mmetsp:Transcript_13029/g.41612  ORF Transcript_13029/g.41612 Transcript_13029/m.41612 type:complete len:252 (+) Transcript_13029:61-816(+)
MQQIRSRRAQALLWSAMRSPPPPSRARWILPPAQSKLLSPEIGPSRHARARCASRPALLGAGRCSLALAAPDGRRWLGASWASCPRQHGLTLARHGRPPLGFQAAWAHAGGSMTCIGACGPLESQGRGRTWFARQSAQPSSLSSCGYLAKALVWKGSSSRPPARWYRRAWRVKKPRLYATPRWMLSRNLSACTNLERFARCSPFGLAILSRRRPRKRGSRHWPGTTKGSSVLFGRSSSTEELDGAGTTRRL